MMCDHCGERDAVIHLTHIENNEMHSFHLCEACAAEKGIDPDAEADVNEPLAAFLAQMGDERSEAADAPDAECPYCSLSLEGFKKTGRLGCSQCYVAFESHLRNLMRRLHAGTQHVGKVYLPPEDATDVSREERLNGLKRRLTRAVDSEDFERAAKIRDQIRSLEGA
ncbi:MAG TPA: UvrB/UvrC motif-containing protein [Longimicrobiales bacterium]|nr:UvrB/UvrC motif-containing protein [Longimicrobiales bacterium]